jgi:hypothetical protein
LREFRWAKRGYGKVCITSFTLCWNLIWYKMLAEVKATMIEIKEEVISSAEVFRELGG